MTDPLEQAQQQLRELRDSLQTQLEYANRLIVDLATVRLRRDEFTAALKGVEASLAPRTRKRKQALPPIQEADPQ